MNSNDVIKSSILNIPDEPEGVMCNSTWNKYLMRHHLSFGIRPMFKLRRCDQLLVVNVFSLIL